MSATNSPGSIVLLIKLTRSVYRRASEDVLGLKLKAYMVLTNLRDGGLPQADLCASMQMDANNTVLLLNDLEGKGFVERRRDPADRRRHIVVITDAGQEALRHAERAMESLEEEVFGSLTAEGRAALRDLLSRAVAEEPADQQAAA
ncbi:MarR family winged helix-turn-helix transcriptional regulator [Solirubrobacter phytolaccae]|uniref:MarR family winged helix-turn-helix transcriptional regulator n=1 Tax=Solirubrobacter phytolaccae TaxID=1404360 RepID=A0A9X3SCB1_9ACTN|nr:MarR family winged helix-turn-helix transcriptional regulator [Solirubrobacter phytolaccae]MDA0185628.1 MarR family winged helix-turn-helix transcriptional regulator [Solirubrobacter phytolaccae]